MDMGKSVNIKPQQNTAKQKQCAYFLGYNVSPGAPFTNMDYFLNPVKPGIKLFL